MLCLYQVCEPGFIILAHPWARVSAVCLFDQNQLRVSTCSAALVMFIVAEASLMCMEEIGLRDRYDELGHQYLERGRC